MRKLFLISQVIIFFYVRSYSQAAVSIECDDSWGPGRLNKVEISIMFENAEGFARFTQEFPEGFEIYGEKVQEADFYVNDNRLTAVWMRIPENRMGKFTFLVKPDNSLSGTIDLAGHLAIITEGKYRKDVNAKAKTILIGGTNGFLPEEKEIRSNSENVTIVTNQKTESNIIFRVQVKTSQEKISVEKLKKDLGLKAREKITAVASGKSVKYQAGDYNSYQEAGAALRTIRERGFPDAFIVAYSGDKQISVENARKAK